MTLLPLRADSEARSDRSREPSAASWDRWLLGATLAVLAMGSLLVWSATSGHQATTGAHPSAYLSKHLVNIVIGLVLGVVVSVIDHRRVRILVPVAYAASVLGLALVLVMGTTINGSRSWLMVGGLSLQPAELAKLAVVVGMALVLAERLEGSRTGEVGASEVALMLAVAGVPALLIVAQPDLGTLLVLTATVFGVLGVAGVPRRWLAALAGLGLLGATLAVVGGMLKAYQVDRFLAFTDPRLDPRGAGYNTTQARIAIGNGGLFGQGLGHGSQTQAGFVPEQHTDFVFTVAGEELGLIGAAVLVALLGVILWRALAISTPPPTSSVGSRRPGSPAGSASRPSRTSGCASGSWPVTGVPLPLVSYGGSSMFASLMAIGLLQNIHRRTVRAQV